MKNQQTINKDIFRRFIHIATENLDNLGLFPYNRLSISTGAYKNRLKIEKYGLYDSSRIEIRIDECSSDHDYICIRVSENKKDIYKCELVSLDAFLDYGDWYEYLRYCLDTLCGICRHYLREKADPDAPRPVFHTYDSMQFHNYDISYLTM